MRDYIVEHYPRQLEDFDTCTKLGKIKTEKYWCFIKDKVTQDLFSEESSEFVGVFTRKQMGYKLASERVPFPSEEELLELVKELHVVGEDMKKTKWQLLAEAYINGN